MHMDFVGAELGTALAHAGEIDRLGVIQPQTNVQRRGAAVICAPDENVYASRQRRAFDKIVNPMRISPAGSTAPDLVALC